MEIWKDIKGYEGYYQISNKGQVKNIKTNKILTGDINNAGYHRVTLYSPIKQRFFTHRLVALHFCENNNNEKNIVNHKDGNKLNNNINNLEWCTCSENQQHVNEMGLRQNVPCGDKSVMAKLTWDDIHFMREHYKPYDEQYNTTMLAKMFNIHKSEAYAIIANKRWKEEDYHYEKCRQIRLYV